MVQVLYTYVHCINVHKIVNQEEKNKIAFNILKDSHGPKCSEVCVKDVHTGKINIYVK